MATDDRLRLLIERLERLEEEKQALGEDIRDVYAEAKAVGYVPRIIRQIVRERAMKPDDRREHEALLETYRCALGLDFGGTPLGSFDKLRMSGDPVREAAAKLEELAEKDGCTVTMRIGDGPEIPLAGKKKAKGCAPAEAVH